MGDLGNGFLTAIAVNEALFHRARTGEGQAVGTSILYACLAGTSGTFAYPDGSGPDPRSSTPCSSDSTPSTASTRRRTAGSAWPRSPRNTGSVSVV
jgi:crotonobetainyl-CoA:carnitine CoA-transferase CaiB-like acyl-CoA transferase